MNLTKIIDIAEKSGFITSIQRYGFIQGPNDFWFYRLREDFIDSIFFWFTSDYKLVEVPIQCITKNWDGQYDMSKFPSGYDDILFSDFYINEDGIEIGGDYWDVDLEKNILTTFSNITGIIDSAANQWFLNIDSERKLYDSFSERMKESNLGVNLLKKIDA